MLGGRGGPIFTTGYWYVRLCIAIGRRTAGQLSGPVLSLPPQQRQRAVSAVLKLPPDIGLLSLRRLGPVIAELSRRHRPMNTLTREALAAAVMLGADVLMAERNQNHVLEAGVVQEGLQVELVVP